MLLAIALLAFGCKRKPEPIVITPDVQKSHLQRNHIFGNAKIIKTETYYVYEDSLTTADTVTVEALIKSRKPDFTVLQRYTSDGYLLKYYKLNTYLDTVMHRVYRYNDNAQISNWDEYDSLNQHAITDIYIYDRNSFLVGERLYHNDSLVMAFAYKTDGIGNILSITSTHGELSTHTENKYNENGQIYKIIEYEPNGRVFKTATIEYDNYGDEVNRCVYKAGNQMLEYTYNEYNQEGKLIKTIYEDKVHHLKEFHFFANYDKFNNWQTEYLVKNNKLISIRKRQIIYY